ncbi:MAG: lipid-A-disaccharide synthase [Desulfobacterales bacterium]
MTEPEIEKCVLIIAGETSGDFHGAHLVGAMRQKDPHIYFCGMGGDRLKAQGVELLMEAHEISVVGITEVISKLPRVFAGISAIKKIFKRRRPDLVILIDFPDFNLHIAKLAKRQGLSVLYYISPQIWAWRAGRIEKIRRYVDQMAVILPFEQAFYQRHNVPATFVGHPLLDYYTEQDTAIEGDGRDGRMIGILPGSRRGEIEKNLPVMLAAATRIREAYPDIRFLISIAPGIDRQWMSQIIEPYRKNVDIEQVGGSVRRVFENSSLILAASGTVTLETAIFGVPMIIIYRISAISYRLGRALVNVNHIGLVNIIADERVVPELIQEAASPAAIAREAGDILSRPERMQEIRQKLKTVRHRLGTPGAAERTADIALNMLD